MNAYIMSGPPGSGKSFQANGLANTLSLDGENGVIISADHYHCPALLEEILDDGLYMGIPFQRVAEQLIHEQLEIYEFDVAKLSQAHQTCMKAFIYWLQMWKVNPFTVIVDNTNINSYEIAPYYLVGEALGAKVEIIRVERDLAICLKRNVHKVPDEIIEKMHATFSEMIPHPYEEGVMIPKQHMPWWASRTV